MTPIARTIRAVFVGNAPPPDAPLYVLWATVTAFVLLQFVAVVMA